MVKKSMAYKNEEPGGMKEWVSASTNVARTRQQTATPLTQARSPVVHGGRIYFVRAGDAIKIGFTNSLAQRLMDLQVASPTEGSPQ